MSFLFRRLLDAEKVPQVLLAFAVAPLLRRAEPGWLGLLEKTREHLNNAGGTVVF